MSHKGNDYFIDLANGHECTSNCRREGCPLCIHGVHEDIHCEICDKIIENKNIKVEQPEPTETPLWVKNFIDFICHDHTQGDWKQNIPPETNKNINN